MDTLSIIPKPLAVTARDGHFALPSRIDVAADERAWAGAELLVGLLSEHGEQNITLRSSNGSHDGPAAVDLRLDTSLASSNPEGYRLHVSPKGMTIRAGDPRGLLHACQSLCQLWPTEPGTGSSQRAWRVVPCCDIEDEPRFTWRGSLLDTCRHFWTVDDTKRYVDLLALHKCNVLHWHLTEDQGWRIEIRKYPELTGVGAWRKDSRRQRYGGFYTQDQIRDVVTYAQARGVTVVPEIEMPGHSVAALAAYPSLSCAGKSLAVRTKWGISDDVYCAGNEKTFEFLEDVLTEVMALFPSRWIHVGGDECPKVRWQACSKCQERIRREGLANEFELQKYFINRIECFLSANGRILVGWDEILESNATGQGHRAEIDFAEDSGAFGLTHSAMVQS